MYSSVKIACLLLAFAVCVCQSHVVPLADTNDDVHPCRNFTNQNILDILEELRERMDRPLPRFNIPILEPLSVDDITIDDFDLLAGTILLTNNSFAGFSRFQTFDLDLNVIGFFLNLTLVVPELEISGWHVSNGSLLGLVPVIGEGTFNLTVHNVTFDVTGKLNHTGSEWIAHQLSLNFTIDRIDGGFNNLTDPFLNELLQAGGPELIELIWPDMAPAVEEVVANAAAQFMNYFSIEELMGMLHGEGMNWSDLEPDTTTTGIPPTSTTGNPPTATTSLPRIASIFNMIMKKKAAGL